MAYLSFSANVLRIAARLERGEAGGSYLEACLLISALLSGISADIWTGTGIDRRRFSELWARWAEPQLLPNQISVPLLLADLKVKGRTAEVAAIARMRPDMFGAGHDARLLTGAEVDAPELDLTPLGLSAKDLRPFSYGALFYTQIRCGIVHEYQIQESASSMPMTQRDASVSYCNTLVRGPGHRIHRSIHFHMPWLLQLAESIATRLDAAATTPPSPTVWWLDG